MSKKTLVIIGGRARSLVNFRGELIVDAINRGYRVIAMAAEIDEVTASTLNSFGAETVSYKLQRTGMNVFTDVLTFVQLFLFFRSKRPEFVLSYTIKPVIYASLAARLAGVKNIFSMITGLGFAFSNNGWKHKIITFIATYLYKLALAQNKHVFFQNADDKCFFENTMLEKNKATIINGSGVDIQYFDVVSMPNEPRFLMIARLLKEKGVREYVAAAREVRKVYPKVPFDLVGWVDESPSAIKKEDLANWIGEGVINYLGKKDDVRTVIKNSSIYVLPSYREGTPRTVLEAMSMGRAIITTNAPGCRETVVHEVNGFLVPVKDMNALTKAMIAFVERPELMATMGANSRQLAVDKYEVKKVNKVILDVMFKDC